MIRLLIVFNVSQAVVRITLHSAIQTNINIKDYQITYRYMIIRYKNVRLKCEQLGLPDFLFIADNKYYIIHKYEILTFENT